MQNKNWNTKTFECKGFKTKCGQQIDRLTDRQIDIINPLALIAEMQSGKKMICLTLPYL